MKILVITDSHNRIENIVKAYEKEKPDVILSAGDYISDVIEFSYMYDNVKVYGVKGNGDIFVDNYKFEEIIELQNIKIFLTHGHMDNVKAGYGSLIKNTQNLNVDIVIFGHTHKPCEFTENNIYYFNPGALMLGSYGIINISENKKIEIKIKKLEE